MEERGLPNLLITIISKNGTMFLVKKRPTAVRRKLLSEMRLVSKGKYQGRGDSFTSFARSFSHMTFGHKKKRNK